MGSEEPHLLEGSANLTDPLFLRNSIVTGNGLEVWNIIFVHQNSLAINQMENIQNAGGLQDVQSEDKFKTKYQIF
jgi:hypothetical protein